MKHLLNIEFSTIQLNDDIVKLSIENRKSEN